jgi:hypothetical protein
VPSTHALLLSCSLPPEATHLHSWAISQTSAHASHVLLVRPRREQLAEVCLLQIIAEQAVIGLLFYMDFVSCVQGDP